MDEFLRDIHASIFKKWILAQEHPNFQMTIDEDNPNFIYLNTEFGEGLITFNQLSIIEFQVTNTYTGEIEFYLHFQMKTLHHALELFYEMIDSLKKLVDRPITKVLFSCSGGLTTSFFASKMNEAANLLFLDMESTAIGYNRLFDVGSEYDVILLAPQISFMHAKVQEILKDQLVIKIPPQVFAKYDVGKMLAIIKEESQKAKPVETKPENVSIHANVECHSKILSLSIIRNSNRVHIAYRLYGPDNQILEDNEIIKPTITLTDIFDVIDTMLVQHSDIEICGISLPGIINEKTISSANIHGLGEVQIEHITSRYKQKIIFSNDVNAATVGYYATQTKYRSLSMVFQPVSSFAGAGMIINGQLISGRNNLAGEVQYLPFASSEDKLTLNKTPEGMVELVSKIVLSIIGVISPDAIVLFCTLITDLEDLKKELGKTIPENYIPDLIKIEDLNEYSLLGGMILCSQSLAF